MMDVIPDALVSLLDPNRLAVAGALVNTPRTSSEVADQTGLDQRVVIESLGQLRQVGIVRSDGGHYRISVEELRRLANEVADTAMPMDPSIGFGMTDDETAVLERFFSGRTLTDIPTSRAKRLIVLERLAQEFDLGRRYTESDVNAMLHPFNTDVASLRRYLVDEGLLDRDGGRYLRSGGRAG